MTESGFLVLHGLVCGVRRKFLLLVKMVENLEKCYHDQAKTQPVDFNKSL